MPAEVAIDPVTVEYLAAEGKTAEEIASVCGVTPQTFLTRRNAEPELARAFERGRALYDGPKGKGKAKAKAAAAVDEFAEKRAERARQSESRGEADILAVRAALFAAGAEGLCMRELRDITGLDYSRINLAVERMFMEISEETRGLVSFYRLKNRA